MVAEWPAPLRRGRRREDLWHCGTLVCSRSPPGRRPGRHL